VDLLIGIIMDRRRFLVTSLVGVLAAPLTAWAQQAAPLRIGWLSTAPHPFIRAFRAGLRDLGYVEGKNVVIEERYAEGQPDRLLELASELVARRIDVFVTSDSAAALAAKATTTRVPIVSITGDNVGSGVVRSLAHPGAHVTGLDILAVDLSVKRLELLKGAIPRLKRVGILVETSQSRQFKGMSAAEPLLGPAAHPACGSGCHRLRRRLHQSRRGASRSGHSCCVGTVRGSQARVVALSAKHRLPAMYEHRDFVDAGGLMSYGPNLDAVFQRAAIYVDRIVKGAKPAELPVEQPTKFELVINLKTAKALDLTIPPSLVLRADQVIDQ
jgi:putative ABC transport system substrate-binding protein